MNFNLNEIITKLQDDASKVHSVFADVDGDEIRVIYERNDTYHVKSIVEGDFDAYPVKSFASLREALEHAAEDFVECFR